MKTRSGISSGWGPELGRLEADSQARPWGAEPSVVEGMERSPLDSASLISDTNVSLEVQHAELALIKTSGMRGSSAKRENMNRGFQNDRSTPCKEAVPPIACTFLFGWIC